MKILLIGSGAREQAMAQALLQSPLCSVLMVAPGNPGIANLTTTIPVKSNDVDGLVAMAVKEKIDFVIVGPEEPLTLGIYDAMTARGLACLGPSRAAASLEGSKIIMKEVAVENNIPTARYKNFDDANMAKAFASELWQETKKPIVIKTDGLAAGKGVIIAENLLDAHRAIDDVLLEKKFGEAGSNIVIEEFLTGREVSYFVLSDGNHWIFMGSAEDHKKAFDNDKGPNTGGMGAFSPSPILSKALQAQVEKEIVGPTIAGMKDRGWPYVGILFFGLMVEDDKAKLLEINIRLGDPEAAVILQTMQTDLLIALLSAQRGALEDFSIKHWHDAHGVPQTALAVVMASKGYPEKPLHGQKIILPNILPEDVVILHAGTGLDADNNLVAKGGRVLTVVATAGDIAGARRKVYDVIDKIDFPDSFYRHDIGTRGKKR